MKKTLLVLFTLLSTFLTFAGNWPGVCDNLTFTYELEATSDPLQYKMKVVITNTGTEALGSYCDIFETTTAGVTLNGSPSCYPSLAAGATKDILFDVDLTNANIENFELYFKTKDGIDDTKYCDETKTFWLGAALSVEEIDRADMPYTSTYFDLTGRQVASPEGKGLLIEKRRYEDGFEMVEKLYFPTKN